jgi:putative redox protein
LVTTESTPARYLTIAANGRSSLRLDAPSAKGGAGHDFGPHELLEAALASCLNMAVRMHASAHALPLESVASKVRLVRPATGAVCYEYSLELTGPLTEAQRATLMSIAEQCPVRTTLQRPVEFRALPHETL